MIKKLAIALAVIVLAILAYAATKPDTFRVERSTTIKAPPEKIFALINDIHNWQTWSPYEKKDPNMKRTFSGAASGKGAIYEWQGNDDVGQGKMEITEINPPTKVIIALHFIKPFQGDNTAEFSLEPQGNSTKVTWAMYGPNTYMCKIMQTFLDVNNMCGKDFDNGLAALKATSEK